MNNFTPATTNYKLLLIDDDDDDQEIFLSALSDLQTPFICQTVNNGQVALDKLKSGVLEAQLIFLDLNMPLMNGREFLIHLRSHEQLSHLPVYIFSTTNDARTITETMELGADRFVSKPSSYQGLVSLLSYLLETQELPREHNKTVNSR